MSTTGTITIVLCSNIQQFAFKTNVNVSFHVFISDQPISSAALELMKKKKNMSKDNDEAMAEFEKAFKQAGMTNAFNEGKNGFNIKHIFNCDMQNFSFNILTLCLL